VNIHGNLHKYSLWVCDSVNWHWNCCLSFYNNISRKKVDADVC
jgi:hypothetical protein